MSKKEKGWFNWHCAHCNHRNRVAFSWQFEMPNNYSAIWECDNCGKENRLMWNLEVNGWWEKKKAPKLRKKVKEEKKRKKEAKEDGRGEECENSGYKNYRAKQKI